MLSTFNPDKQIAFTADLERAYNGSVPSLGVIARAYGNGTPIAWLLAQLVDLSEYSGCKDKLTPKQARNIAEVIFATWPHFKLTELMHFFLRFKAGKYGKFYGAVDGLTITNALETFARERIEIKDRLQAEQNEKAKALQRELDNAQCISFNEYCRRNNINPDTPNPLTPFNPN